MEVKVGQIWEDWDIRFRYGDSRRRIKVLEIVGGKAVVQGVSGRGVKRKIRLDRFRPNSTGYKLVEESL